MPIDQLVELFKGVGFPVAVAAYVLLRLDRTLIQVRDELRELRRLTGDRRRNLSAEER